MLTVFLLFASNVFMTVAWYGHLKFSEVPLWKVILISWGIAFVEYCLQVPANRIGYQTFTAFELKTIQEVLSLGVFALFAALYLGEPMRWNHALGFLFILLAVVFIFHKW